MLAVLQRTEIVIEIDMEWHVDEGCNRVGQLLEELFALIGADGPGN